jgi:hypothetical protein
MNANYRRVPTWFAPETTFEVTPHAPKAARLALDAELESLKNRLLREQLATSGEDAMVSLLRRAANEAAALVWLTPYPLLLLPVLFEEKVAQARLQATRQDTIRRRSRFLLAQAA